MSNRIALDVIQRLGLGLDQSRVDGLMTEYMMRLGAVDNRAKEAARDIRVAEEAIRESLAEHHGGSLPEDVNERASAYFALLRQAAGRHADLWNRYAKKPVVVSNNAGTVFDEKTTNGDLAGLDVTEPRTGLAREAARRALEIACEVEWGVLRPRVSEPLQPTGIVRDFHIPGTYHPFAQDPLSTVEPDGVAMRVVRNYDSARATLTERLRAAEQMLDIPRDATLMPFVLVMGHENGVQEIFLGAKDHAQFQRQRHAIENRPPMAELGTLKPGDHGKANIQALREYEPAIGGFLIDGRLRGAMYGQSGTLPLANEPYGPYSYFHNSIAFNLEGDERRDAYGERGPVTARFRALWNDPAVTKKLVTLGPEDDIVGILAGRYVFEDDAWHPRPEI